MPFDRGNIPKLAESKKPAAGAAGAVMTVCVLVVVGIVALVAFLPRHSGVQNRPAALSQAAPDSPYNPGQSIADAKASLLRREYRMALTELQDLHPDDLKRPGVQAMVAKATQGVQVAEAKEKRAARVSYADEYERALLSAGMDATVRATGQNADALAVTYVLINRPFVYGIENDQALNAKLVALGFKSVRLGDGFDASWSYKPK